MHNPNVSLSHIFQIAENVQTQKPYISMIALKSITFMMVREVSAQ